MTDIVYPPHYNELVKELAIAMIYRIKRTLHAYPNPVTGGPDVYDHMYQSDFEIPFDALWRLDMAHVVFFDKELGKYIPLKEEDWKEYEDSFRTDDGRSRLPGMPKEFFFCSEDEIRGTFSIQMVKNPPSTGSLFEGYFRVSDFAPTGEELPVVRESFTLQCPRLRNLVNALTKSGYMTEIDGQFLWTDKVAAYWNNLMEWSRKRRDVKFLDQDKIFRESEAILASFNDPKANQPPKFCYVDSSYEAMAIAIMQFWNGEAWLESALVEPGIYFDEAIHIAELIKDPSS